jgi:hypothetical protein
MKVRCTKLVVVCVKITLDARTNLRAPRSSCFYFQATNASCIILLHQCGYNNYIAWLQPSFVQSNSRFYARGVDSVHD